MIPHFIGGEEAMFRYLNDNLKFPQQMLDAGIQGIVHVKFVVSKTGEVKNIKKHKRR